MRVPGAAVTAASSSFSSWTMKLLTFNVAQCKPHSQAPQSFSPLMALYQEIAKYNPDVLALQELPYRGMSFKGYDCIGEAQSHCGIVGLFGRKQHGWVGGGGGGKWKRLSVPPGTCDFDMMAPELPAVLASLTLDDENNNNDDENNDDVDENNNNNNRTILFGSCHLEPFKEHSSTRFAQLNAIAQIGAFYDSLVLGGDFNMRKAEEPKIEKELQLVDAWKESGSDKRTRDTWNSNINHYHKNGFGFACRFDRVYLRNVAHVSSFGLVAHQPLESGRFGSNYYLSDHFGIVTELSFRFATAQQHHNKKMRLTSTDTLENTTG